MGLFNQFSYPLFAVVLGMVIVLGLVRVPKLNTVVRIAIAGGYIVVAVLVGMQFRYPDSPVQVDSIADVEATLTNNTPTFVMLYSNY